MGFSRETAWEVTAPMCYSGIDDPSPSCKTHPTVILFTLYRLRCLRRSTASVLMYTLSIFRSTRKVSDGGSAGPLPPATTGGYGRNTAQFCYEDSWRPILVRLSQFLCGKAFFTVVTLIGTLQAIRFNLWFILFLLLTVPSCSPHFDSRDGVTLSCWAPDQQSDDPRSGRPWPASWGCELYIHSSWEDYCRE